MTKLKGEINYPTAMVGAFNIPLSMMYKTDKQQISREIKKFLMQYTTKTKQTYIECSIQKKKKKQNAHSLQVQYEKFFCINHMLNNKTSLNSLKCIDIVQYVF